MMNKRLAKLQKELDISDTHNMPSTDIILKNVNKLAMVKLFLLMEKIILAMILIATMVAFGKKQNL